MPSAVYSAPGLSLKAGESVWDPNTRNPGTASAGVVGLIQAMSAPSRTTYWPDPGDRAQEVDSSRREKPACARRVAAVDTACSGLGGALTQSPRNARGSAIRS